MSQYVESNCKTFEADEAIAKYLRVKLDSDGKITTAGATDKDIGTAESEAFAAGDDIAVRLSSATGTQKCVAAGAITVGAAVHTAASGKVNDTQATGAFVYGIALEGASADGDIIEVLRNSHGDTAGS